MKKNLFFGLIATIVLLIAASCSGKKGSSGTENTSGDSTGTTASFAVCVWDRTPVKDTPDEKGKWLASLNLGEKCTYLDDTEEVNNGTKTTTYYKIKLLDGKEGWAQSDLVILNSRPAVFIQNADIYSRPDLLTKTTNLFTKMDIVAVKSTQNGFVEIVGKRKEGKWIEKAWVKEANLTYTDVDIAVAKFAVKAIELTDKTKRMEAINTILNNSDLSSSVFITDLKSIVSADEEIIEEKIDTSDLSIQ
jgi:hypothetical protein